VRILPIFSIVEKAAFLNEGDEIILLENKLRGFWLFEFVQDRNQKQK